MNRLLCASLASVAVLMAAPMAANAYPRSQVLFATGTADLQGYDETVNAAINQAEASLQDSCNRMAGYGESAQLHDIQQPSVEVHRETAGFVAIAKVSGTCTVQ